MKQTLHTSRRAFKLALLCLMAFVTWGGNYCIAQETAYKTLSFPDGNSKEVNSYVETWSATISGFTWEIANFNNNNNNPDWKFIRAGSRKGESVATIDNTTPFDKAIGKIVVDVEKDVEARFVKSICLQVASDVNFSNVIETVKLTYYKKTDFVFNVSAPQANLYYRLKFDLKKGSGNGFVQINKVEYYEDASNKTATSLSFDAPSYTISKDQTLTKLPTLKADEKPLFGKTITWSSDNENVATVEANTGVVTGIGAGTAKITATFAGDEVYKTSTASYEIKVKGAPALSFSQTSYTIEMGDAFSEPTLQGLPTGVTAKYSSSNADVATVDESTGKVQIVGVGTTTIKAVSEAKDVYEAAEASYELTVKPASKKIVDIDFSKYGYQNAGDVEAVEVDGVKVSFLKNGAKKSSKWYDADNSVHVYKNNKILIEANAPIYSVQFILGKSNIITDCTTSDGEYTKGYWSFSNVETNSAYLVNKGNAAFVEKIIVTTKLPTSVGTISIAAPEGFGTYYNSNSYILPKGLTAFGYKEVNTDGTLVKTDEFTGGDVVPANAALVVKGNTGKYECYATDKEATKTLEGNLLKGVTTDTRFEATSGVKRYILTRADDGILAFYRTNSGTINVKANRAYLEVPTAMAVASFSLEGTATGINNVVTTAAKQGIYTISGVRLNATTTKELPAGIYIVDGKKVIVK
jgi:cell wall surface anchor family protein